MRACRKPPSAGKGTYSIFSGFSAWPSGLGWRLALGAPILLISVIGGRIIPSFTRNWLFKRKSPRLPSPQDMLDTAAVGVLAAALIL
ncbi:MAG: NnrS family protein [Rhodoplanes sp.]